MAHNSSYPKTHWWRSGGEFKKGYKPSKDGIEKRKRTIGKRFKSGELSGPNKKEGKWINNEGYVLIWSPNHPNTTSNNYVMEHRLVMEEYLGRYLKKEEVVHHINKNRLDNRIENLMLFKNDMEHKKFHKRKDKNA